MKKFIISVILFSFTLILSTIPLVGAQLKELVQIQQWDVFEIQLEGTQQSNPFIDVKLMAEFKNRDKIVTTKGFYDGNGNYKIRFMPDQLGEWNYVTISNQANLDGVTGSFPCVAALENNHGPVRVRKTWYLAYEDGTPYFQVGTTCYAWTHQSMEMQEQTLATLEKAPFNKIRMCIFPKDYAYNHNEPTYFVFPRQNGKNDYTQFCPEYFANLEKRILQLQKLGIEADLILFHPYDRWGYQNMGDEVDQRYLEYLIARLSSFRNVWWSMANEYDLMRHKNIDDWDRLCKIVHKNDPYNHMLSIHNCHEFYDHTKPWITHASIQSTNFADAVKWREKYRKPLIYDECRYEGDISSFWGQLTPEEMTGMFWKSLLNGTYAGHGETYHRDDEVLWWSKGGVLFGKSPERIEYFKNFVVKALNFEKMQPLRDDEGNFILALPGKYYLVYGSTSKNVSVTLTGDMAYKVDAIDTWNMMETSYGTAQPGVYTFASLQENLVYRFVLYAPGEKMRPEVVAAADVIQGNVPLTVRFSSPSEMKQQWNFGDGIVSQKSNPKHVFEKFGSYIVTLTLTDDVGVSASTALAVTVLPAVPGDLNKYKKWPGSTSDLQFVWQNDIESSKVKVRGDAIISDAGEMIIGQGAFIGQDVNEQLLSACQVTNQLTVEGLITISNIGQGGPARIISFSKDTDRRNFTLGQEGNNIVMRLRTPQTGANGLNPQVSVCPITPNESMHIIVSYYPDNLFCYLNGELVYQGSDIRGDFSNWEACFLIFGDEMTGNRNWNGKIKNISIYNRFVGPAEAGYKYKLLNEKQ